MDRIAAVVLVILFGTGPAVRADQPPRPTADATTPVTASIKKSIEKIRFDASPLARTRPFQQPSSRKQTGRKVAMAVGFGLLGGFIGASIGESVTQHCACDDPGYGAMVGFPIGAIAGAAAGVWLASR